MLEFLYFLTAGIVYSSYPSLDTTRME
jgi:hypothetical protein